MLYEVITLFKAVDDLLYKAKAFGKNKVHHTDH